METQKQPPQRLFIRILDNSKPVEVDEYGRKWASTKWKEVVDVNLGSRKNPNKEIIQVRWEPVVLEKEPQKINLNDFFKKFGLFE
jgi:hypothetical protein